MNAEPTRTTDWYLDHILRDAERFATVLDTCSTDVPVAACPDWDVLRLAQHLGHIHRWAAFCATQGRPPTSEDPPMEPFDQLRAGDWLRDGATRLVEQLRDLDPDAPSWHPFPVDLVARVWPRRQAHETSMHTWDAERAVGVDARIDAELASDGIDEYFEIAVPRLVAREGIDLPDGSLHVHCTDVDGEWLVWSDDGEYRMIRQHQKGDAAVRGPAEAVVLRLWGRVGDRADELTTIGDEAVLSAWLSISGM
jgi:uncharacterized protein (TIGR03083 family)